MPSRRGFLIGAAAAGAWPFSAAVASGQSDIAILRRAYTLLHPGLYRYASPAMIERGLTQLEAAFAANDDLAARYLALSRFTGMVRCGHSYANFYNQKKAVQEALFAGGTRLPFHFRWLGERMILTADHSGSALKPGTEIVSIDGRPARSVLRALLPLARADGRNDAKRRALLEVQGRDGFESFDVYQSLLFPPRGSRFALIVRPPAGRRTSLSVDPIDLAARRGVMPSRETGPDAPIWTLDHRGGAAILTMPSWTLYNSKWDWSGWLDAAFDEIVRRGSTALIVDLRRNEGGREACGHAIIARLIDAPLPLGGYERRVRFRRTPDDLAPYLDTWDPSFKTLGERATDLGAGFLRLPDEGMDQAIAPKAPRFTAQLAVLVSPQNSSATFQFAELIQRHRLGRLIGEPTGGNQRGINGGAYFFLRLPESGLEADLPLIGYFPREPRPDAGLTPDIAAPVSPRDIAVGRDATLERALTLLA